MTKCFPLVLLLCAPSACMDPAHDDAVAALGGEKAGVPRGPLHRAGQPCLTCHGGEGPADAEFSIAGTVYLYAFQDDPAPGTIVLLEDIDGVAGTVPTNEVGSFYVKASDFRPKYPVSVQLTYGKAAKSMPVNINRSGSCGDCHKDPPGETSPGRVYVAINPTTLNKIMRAE